MNDRLYVTLFIGLLPLENVVSDEAVQTRQFGMTLLTISSNYDKIVCLGTLKPWIGPDITPDMRQSKTLLTIGESVSKLARNSVFDCHLSPVGRQMAIEISVSNDFLTMSVDSISVFDCRLFGVDKRIFSQ